MTLRMIAASAAMLLIAACGGGGTSTKNMPTMDPTTPGCAPTVDKADRLDGR